MTCFLSQDAQAVPHHIDHRGNHDAENLVTLCWRHHTALHDGDLVVTIENGEPRFARTEKTRASAGLAETAVRAFAGMGFRKSEAQSFVETAVAHVGKSATLSELVREALKRSPMPT